MIAEFKMSLQTDTNLHGNDRDNGNHRINMFTSYNGAELLGYTNNSGKYYSPEEMWFALNELESILFDEKLGKAAYMFVRAIERERHYPEGWLNLVISGLITRSKKGFAEKLVGEFRDRGYSDSWLNKARS